MRKNIFQILCLLMALAAALNACAPATPFATATPASLVDNLPTAAPVINAAAPTEIRIGAIYAQSGETATHAEDIQRGLEFIIEQINTAGGIQSLGGAKLTLVSIDSQGSPQTAAEAVASLAQKEGVAAIICADSSAAALASREAERLGVPLIVTNGALNQVTAAGTDYTFRINPNLSQAADGLTRFIQDLPGLGAGELVRIALLTQSGLEADMQTLIKNSLTAAGISLVFEDTFKDSAGLPASLAALREAQPDLVLVAAEPALRLEIARTAGLGTAFLVDVSADFTLADQLAQAGGAFEGWLTLADFTNTYNSPATVRSMFNLRYKTAMTRWAIYPYQAGWVLAVGLEKAASIERSAVQKALSSTSLSPDVRMVLPADALVFSEDGQNTHAPLFAAQVQNGELKTIWPVDYLEANLLSLK